MRLSASRYHLAILCGYPFRPDVEVPDMPAGAAAQLGTEAHSYVEAASKGIDPKTLFFQPEANRIGETAMGWLSGVDVPTAVELAIAYDAETDTARRIDAKGPRDYGTTKPSEIAMTLDLVWVYEDHVVVRDFKTGKKQNAHREQLVVQALGATRLYGKPSAKVGFLWGRKTKCEPDALETLNAAALDAASWEVAATLRGLPFATTAKGQHCFFCPVSKARACPAYEPPTEEERNGVNA